jgi:hypothetical protein
LREKISLFCNVPYEAVVEETDVEHTIYELPLMLQRERVDDLVCRLLHLDTPPANMSHWQEIIRKLLAPRHRVRIGVVGKYIELHDAYKSVYEAITHGGVANDCGVEIEKVEAEAIEKFGAEKMLKGLGGILVPGGFGERGIEGKIEAARYAREQNVPYLGLCLGMQVATIEFARNVLKLEKAHSTEFNPDTRIRSSRCWTSKRKSPTRAAPCAWDARPANWWWAAWPTGFTAPSSSTSATATATNSTTIITTPSPRPGLSSADRRPTASWWKSSNCPIIPFSSPANFIRSFKASPTSRIPLFKGFIAAAHSKCDLAVAAVETRWQAWRPEMDAIFSAAVPPLERLKKYYESNYLFQSEMKAKYGRVLGCAHLALGSEVCTHEDSLRRKIENILTEKRKYLESAIRDAHASGVIHAPDAEAKARMIQAYYQGLLTQARIQNDAKVLRDAAQGVFMILGVKERRAPAANSNVSLQV